MCCVALLMLKRRVYRETCPSCPSARPRPSQRRGVAPAKKRNSAHTSTYTLMAAAAAARVYTCFLLTWLITKTNGKTPDVPVTCLFSEDCILPCSFKATGGEEVQWFRQNDLVYSLPQGSDQPSEQFVGRTSVSAQQLALGNAALSLQRCGLQDRGRYRCRIIKGKEEDESFVIVKVEAPIQSVNVEITRLSGFEEVKCSTQGVYPAPHVSWTTEPPTSLKPITRKIPNRLGLYDVESKLKKLRDRSSFTYICTVNSSYSTQTWTTSLTETVINQISFTSKSYSSLTWTGINSAEGKDLTIPCKAPWVTQNFTLTWTFKLTRTNKPTVICTYDSWTQLLTNQWEGRAGVDALALQAGDGSLQLLSPLSAENTGTYSCTISSLQRRHESQTAVNITALAHESERMEVKPGSSVQWWIPTVIFAALAVTGAVIVGVLKLKDDCLHSNSTEKDRDSHQVKVTVTDIEAVSEGSHLTADPTDEHT
ncbi:hypothetical protein AMEX_G2179 [Astyanax mexicanus]|uniref:Ig-like domain-containing protein n=1 Tax=Astyanax mexicanus TaxID=7994 RepID=A0A8T2MGI9_ASTMX|nr:hypothetical protein AMEX_G2179 [Astyanax mexicanus]